jgi:hypothetical protein
MSCDYCTNPLYVGTKCKNCGREPAPVQEPVAWMHTAGHIQGRNPNWEPVIADGYTQERSWTPLYTTPPAAAVPDAIHHTDLSETLEYIQGWNDCRAEMLKGMSNA